jgi:hypothetical protein
VSLGLRLVQSTFSALREYVQSTAFSLLIWNHMLKLYSKRAARGQVSVWLITEH